MYISLGRILANESNKMHLNVQQLWLLMVIVETPVNDLFQSKEIFS